VGLYQEEMAFKEVSELEYAPHNADEFALPCRIMFLSRAEATASNSKPVI